MNGIEVARRSDSHQPCSLVSTIRFPKSSTRSRWPGKTTVEAAGSSTTAGPSSSAPGPSSARSKTCASRRPSASKSTSREPFERGRCVAAAGEPAQLRLLHRAEPGDAEVDELDRRGEPEGVELLVQVVEAALDLLELVAVRRPVTRTVCS